MPLACHTQAATAALPSTSRFAMTPWSSSGSRVPLCLCCGKPLPVPATLTYVPSCSGSWRSALADNWHVSLYSPALEAWKPGLIARFNFLPPLSKTIVPVPMGKAGKEEGSQDVDEDGGVCQSCGQSARSALRIFPLFCRSKARLGTRVCCQSQCLSEISEPADVKGTVGSCPSCLSDDFSKVAGPPTTTSSS